MFYLGLFNICPSISQLRVFRFHERCSSSSLPPSFRPDKQRVPAEGPQLSLRDVKVLAQTMSDHVGTLFEVLRSPACRGGKASAEAKLVFCQDSLAIHSCALASGALPLVSAEDHSK